MTASSSLSGEEWNERIHWPALFGWVGSTDQLFLNERGLPTSSFRMSGIRRPALLKWAESVDPLFHMSWATKYLVFSYPTGIWELHFRSDELNCTYELKYRPQKYVGYDKTRFSVIPAHTKERVTHSRSSQKSGSPALVQLKRAGYPLPLVSKERKLTVENKLIKKLDKNTENMILGMTVTAQFFGLYLQS